MPDPTPDANPFAAPDGDPVLAYGHRERLAAIRAVRWVLSASGLVLGCILAAELLPPAAHAVAWRLGLRVAALGLAGAAIIVLAVAWLRLVQRCRPEVARPARLGSLIQILILAVLMLFTGLRLAAG